MEITFICPAMSKPTGGVKVIYKFAELLGANGVKASVLHPGDSSFACTWFEHEAPLRRGRPLKAPDDFAVVPEVWALTYAEKFYKAKISYAIFVQNGYLISWGVKSSEYFRLRSAYETAKVVMSISEDTTQMIMTAFPDLDRTKIVRLYPHIGREFRGIRKTKWISYMPRKLTEHSQKLSFYLSSHLPPNWSLVAVQNRSEQEVAKVFARSSIFLSFCDQEGIALPPLEAALSGNLVIGYTGQGAKEYFSPPNFQEIQNGDFQSFVRAVIEGVEGVEDGLLDRNDFLAGINALRDEYGPENELRHLLEFAKAVGRN